MSVYSQSTIGTATNSITFNDFTHTPIYRVISRQPQRRNLRELDFPIPFESGIADFQTLVGKTTYTIDGVMYPGSESEYDLGLQALRKLSSLEIEQNDNQADSGYVPYVWGEFSQSKLLYIKVLYVQMVENTRKGFVQPFRLICEIKDPTIFGGALKSANTSAATPSASTGTAIYSFIYPIIYGASTYSVSADAINNGDIPTYPLSITIVGPVNTPRITNSFSGEYIEIATNVPSITDTLTLTYDKDTLSVTLNGNSVLNKVSAASTYFKIKPGINTMVLTGSSIGTGAYALVSYRDAYPLS